MSDLRFRAWEVLTAPEPPVSVRAESASASGCVCPTSGPGFRRGGARTDMKAKIVITPKKAVVDPQGKTVQQALEHMGHQGITGVHVGKYLEIDLAPGTDAESARTALDEACHRFLSNPVIEDYRLEME